VNFGLRNAGPDAFLGDAGMAAPAAESMETPESTEPEATEDETMATGEMSDEDAAGTEGEAADEAMDEASASDAPTSTVAVVQPRSPSIMVFDTASYTPAALGSGWMGQTVTNLAGDELGTVSDLIVARDTDEAAVVVEITSAQALVVPVSKFQVVERSSEKPRLRLNYAPDQLQEFFNTGDSQ